MTDQQTDHDRLMQHPSWNRGRIRERSKWSEIGWTLFAVAALVAVLVLRGVA